MSIQAVGLRVVRLVRNRTDVGTETPEDVATHPRS